MVEDKNKAGGGGRRVNTPVAGITVRPVPPERDDNTPVVHIEMQRRPVAMPLQATSEATSEAKNDTVEKLAAALAKRMNSGGAGGGGARRPNRLGSEWLRFFLGWLGAVLLAIGMWYLSVRDALRDRPTQNDIVRMMSEAVSLHEQRGIHPQTDDRLKSIELKQGAMREEQLHQGDQLDTIIKRLDAVKGRP